eukprot:c57380_g1_i1.p1 GENE.c57380_g1_i1~~c57380_g1_i1.p1  ORF type:complete len:134 (+),score=16.20 c57380_g1_i1:186-587(+)
MILKIWIQQIDRHTEGFSNHRFECTNGGILFRLKCLLSLLQGVDMDVDGRVVIISQILTTFFDNNAVNVSPFHQSLPVSLLLFFIDEPITCLIFSALFNANLSFFLISFLPSLTMWVMALLRSFACLFCSLIF